MNYGAIRRLPDSNIMSYWGLIHLTKKALRINLSAHNPPEADKNFGAEGRTCHIVNDNNKLLNLM